MRRDVGRPDCMVLLARPAVLAEPAKEGFAASMLDSIDAVNASCQFGAAMRRRRERVEGRAVEVPLVPGASSRY